MFQGDWIHWLYLLSLLAAGAMLVYVAWWALFSDRARGRRRCPRCWYDLAYSPGMTCSECGYTGRSEKDFAKTRQRKLVGLSAIVGCALLGGLVIDRANERGWATYLPTNVIIWSLPMGSGPDGTLFIELERRITNPKKGITDEQWLAILERCAKGDPAARPAGEVWAAKYGVTLRVWRDRLLASDDRQFRKRVEEILMTIPPRVEITNDRVWPADVAPALDVEARDWWPSWTQMRITATPRLPDAETDVHVRLRDRIRSRAYTLHLPPLPAGEHEVEIDLKIDRRLTGNGADKEWTELEQRVVNVPVQVEGALADAMEPVDSDEMTAMMHEVFAGSALVKYPAGSLPVRIGFSPGETFEDVFDDTAVAIRIDVLRDGRLGRQLDVWWRGGDGNFDRQYAWEVPWLNDAVLGEPSKPNEVWTIRARGVPELALRVDGVTKYWSGQVEVQMPIRPQRSPAPSRGWIPEHTAPGTD